MCALIMVVNLLERYYIIFFAERGITHELTVPHSSSQNGAVERAHGILQTKIRTLLIGGRVPPYLWSEALLCAVYLHNRTPIINGS